MKKKLKIFLLLLLIIILATTGALLYFIKFKEYDVADEEVAQIIEDPYKIEMPDGTTITVDANGDVVDSAGTTSTPVTEGTSSEGTAADGSKGEGKSSGDKVPSSTTGDSDTNEPSQKPTVGSIKKKYVPVLENLQSQADNKLNTLVSHAKKEYSGKKANGESISYGYFYTKYVGTANELEALTDVVFEDVIKVVEKDLVANGFDKSYAQNLVDDYNAKKKARKDSLLNKVIGL
ncbi:hypothetical protein I2483_12915 [Sporosarcina sp. E16_3]|uniref:hypothetical protein n=1 Tax=Sporosarcina sp. E16_3 TaxID=2789293 RepID=UPI001A9264A0|nr:hypothetical protein [Sporosarcina sp. E16_3]MBO0602561.1 hypothetical protein [Sporosarcina sp. E16_3]